MESDNIDHDTEDMWGKGGNNSWSYDGIEVEPYLAERINLSIYSQLKYLIQL